MVHELKQERFTFTVAQRNSLSQVLKTEWSSSKSKHLQQRATNSRAREYFNDLAIYDLETVVGWERSRLDARTTALSKPLPKKKELKKVHGALVKAINKLKDLNSLDSVSIDAQFNRQRRQSLQLELHRLSRVVDQSINLCKTGQKRKPYVWMAMEVARWLLLFEIKPKKTGNMIEILEIVFPACGVETRSVRQSIENAWTDICQPEKTWPDFYDGPPDD